MFVQNSRENTVCQVIWHKPIMLHPSLGISSHFSLCFVNFCHLIAVSLSSVYFVDCAIVCRCSCLVGYVQYSEFIDMRLHVQVSVFSRCYAPLSESGHAVSDWWCWWLSNVRMSPESGNCDWFLSLCQWCSDCSFLSALHYFCCQFLFVLLSSLLLSSGFLYAD